MIFRMLIFASVLLPGRYEAALGEGSTPSNHILHIVYFTPINTDPHPDYQQRLTRVMGHIQGFYREGMRKNGFGPRTFELEHEAGALLKIYLVRGSGELLAYDRDNKESKTRVRKEVAEALTKEGIDFEHEVVIVFQNLLIPENGTLREFGPFIGGGNGVKGSALIYDSPQLDARFLTSNQPDPFVPGKSLGDFNSRYIGGAAHELGHAFGLAHDAESDRVRSRLGKSLMGRGNHDYGEELRGKSRGAFLSGASAFPLSLHPLFRTTNEKSAADLPDKVDFDLKWQPPMFRRGVLQLKGTTKGNTDVAGIVAFNDPSADPSDYDSVGYPSKVTPDGSFNLSISDLTPDRYSLRVRVYASDGRAEHFEYSYQIAANGSLTGSFADEASRD